MKTNIASRQSKISIFIPLEVFVHFFKYETVRMARTMILVTKQERNILQFLNAGWEEKEDNGVQCRVSDDTLHCKYMIENQNFILTFHYNRSHKVCGKFIALDNENIVNNEYNPLMELDVCIQGEVLCVIKLRAKSTL